MLYPRAESKLGVGFPKDCNAVGPGGNDKQKEALVSCGLLKLPCWWLVTGLVIAAAGMARAFLLCIFMTKISRCKLGGRWWEKRWQRQRETGWGGWGSDVGMGVLDGNDMFCTDTCECKCYRYCAGQERSGMKIKRDLKHLSFLICQDIVIWYER